jgi:hypothetical protein
MRKLAIGFVVVALISAVLYLRLHHPKPPLETAYAGNREVTVWSTTAQVRAPVATVSFGDRLEVMGRFGEQVQVRTASGIIGWASERDLLSTEFWQKAKNLGAATESLPVEARGRTRVLSNMHLDPGRDTPRIRQVNKNVAVDLFERRPMEAASPSVAKASDPEPAEAALEARKEDWWLVRAHLPDQTVISGWILGRFIDLEVPAPLPDYASAAGMRVVAWFELNHVPDSAGENKPQYLVLGARGAEGQACDFTMMRVLTWGNQRQRYETAFVESELCGKLPLKLKPGTAPAGDAVFSFQDLSDSASAERLYRMHQTMVRRVREAGAAPAAHPARGKRR